MLTRDELKPWIIDALRANDGKAPMIEVAKHIWQHHQAELQSSGDFFFKWQYEMRWAGQQLVKEKKINKRGQWTLLSSAI
jgi:hypothetical protein